MSRWKRFKESYKRARHAVLSPIIARLIVVILWLILITCRFRNKGLDLFVKVASSKPTILMLWHNRLLIAPYFLSRFTKELIFAAFISKSRDGEFLAKATELYSRGRTIRVPHQARHQALREVIQHLHNTKDIVVITPDGPRGPRYQAKPGIVMAAKEASAAIIPLNWTASSFWELNTWDGLRIPKPFSKIEVSFGEPIYIPKDSPLEMHELTLSLQEAMDKL